MLGVLAPPQPVTVLSALQPVVPESQPRLQGGDLRSCLGAIRTGLWVPRCSHCLAGSRPGKERRGSSQALEGGRH